MNVVGIKMNNGFRIVFLPTNLTIKDFGQECELVFSSSEEANKYLFYALHNTNISRKLQKLTEFAESDFAIVQILA